MINRVILIVLDSVGIGELPDAALYKDQGSNTLSNIAAKMKNFSLPNMEELGLGIIEGVKNIKPCISAKGSFGRCNEESKGKDTVTGHWEIAGVALEKPLSTFPNGFPKNVIEEFEKRIGKKTLGNVVASGTQIIEELGYEHVNTGYPIVYTSADSVFQIAAHEDVIPLDELYKMCKIARELLTGEITIGRVIARPFVGEEGKYTRTSNRHDYALDPFNKTMLDYIYQQELEVAAVGKIKDIYNNKGISKSVSIQNNMDGVDKTIGYIKEASKGLIFTNLVDFDMLYGHRNDVEGYGKALMEFDRRLPEIYSTMKDEDLLILTADHGCDPTTASTDHSREYIPLLVYGKNIKSGINLGTRMSFSDIGKTILEVLNIKNELRGKSFYNLISKEE